MSMHLLTVVAALASASCAAALALEPKAAEAPAAPKVRQLRVKLGRILEHSSGLPPAIAAEAHHVDDDAAHALSPSSITEEASLEKVISEFASFSDHLTGRADVLKKEAVSQLPAGTLEKAEKMLPGLEARVKKVLDHMKADKGQQSPAQVAVVATMDQAIAKVAGQNAFDRAVLLHNALKSAHDFLETRTKELAADRARLNEEIEEQSAFVLFMMLHQRRKLPMKAQAALLKRHQFKDCTYAQKLLKSHSSSQPLDEQLLAMVPKALAEKLEKKLAHGRAGSLSAAGSDGRVQIVSSRMKNAVQVMASELAKAKPMLEQIVHDSTQSAEAKKQASEIMSGLDDVLKKVSSTHDLKSQMDALNEMQTKLKSWMLNAAKLDK